MFVFTSCEIERLWRENYTGSDVTGMKKINLRHTAPKIDYPPFPPHRSPTSLFTLHHVFVIKRFPVLLIRLGVALC